MERSPRKIFLRFGLNKKNYPEHYILLIFFEIRKKNSCNFIQWLLDVLTSVKAVFNIWHWVFIFQNLAESLFPNLQNLYNHQIFFDALFCFAGSIKFIWFGFVYTRFDFTAMWFWKPHRRLSHRFEALILHTTDTILSLWYTDATIFFKKPLYNLISCFLSRNKNFSIWVD